jgi:hypothetical protein
MNCYSHSRNAAVGTVAIGNVAVGVLAVGGLACGLPVACWASAELSMMGGPAVFTFSNDVIGYR